MFTRILFNKLWTQALYILTGEIRIWSSYEKCSRKSLSWISPSTLNRICPSTWNLGALTTSSDSYLPFIQEWMHKSAEEKNSLSYLQLVTEWKRAVILDPLCHQFFYLLSCLMPSLIPPNDYRYRVDQGQTCLMLVNLDQQERLEMFWYVSSRLMTTMLSWHTQPPKYTGNNLLFLGICKGIWLEN